MTSQTVTIEVDQNTALALERLKEKASAQGVTVDSLIHLLVENGSSGLSEERPLYETASPQELAQAYLDWVNSHNREAPGLTLEDVSRESIYEDRW